MCLGVVSTIKVVNFLRAKTEVYINSVILVINKCAITYIDFNREQEIV